MTVVVLFYCNYKQKNRQQNSDQKLYNIYSTINIAKNIEKNPFEIKKEC